MTEDALWLTVQCGERTRTGTDRVLATDGLAAVLGRHRIAASVVLRGAAGFGSRHHLRTDRLLTLSEDLPMVVMAVDAPARIDAALRDVQALHVPGLVTLERARLSARAFAGAVPADDGDAKRKFVLGRHARLEGRGAPQAVVDVLYRHGMAGATVFLGVDGTFEGARRRARFFGANAGVPVLVVAAGAADRAAAALRELGAMLGRSPVTIERVRVCKRDGMLLAEPPAVPATDPTGLALWQRLTVSTSERAEERGAPLHMELVRRLRAAGAAGATSLRGTWGFHGDHRPHGDRFWELRRRVSITTLVVDTPAAVRRWFAIVDRPRRARGPRHERDGSGLPRRHGRPPPRRP